MDDFRFAARIEQDEPRTAFYVREQGSCQRLKGSCQKDLGTNLNSPTIVKDGQFEHQ